MVLGKEKCISFFFNFDDDTLVWGTDITIINNAHGILREMFMLHQLMGKECAGLNSSAKHVIRLDYFVKDQLKRNLKEIKAGNKFGYLQE